MVHTIVDDGFGIASLDGFSAIEALSLLGRRFIIKSGDQSILKNNGVKLAELYALELEIVDFVLRATDLDYYHAAAEEQHKQSHLV